jgi:hypothetical protein
MILTIMIVRFVDRREELSTLDKLFKSGEAQRVLAFNTNMPRIPVTRGQIKYEFNHLLSARTVNGRKTVVQRDAQLLRSAR